MGWFSSDDNDTATQEKNDKKILAWAWRKLQEKKQRDAERAAQKEKDAEAAVRRALDEDKE